MHMSLKALLFFTCLEWLLINSLSPEDNFKQWENCLDFQMPAKESREDKMKQEWKLPLKICLHVIQRIYKVDSLLMIKINSIEGFDNLTFHLYISRL